MAIKGSTSYTPEIGKKICDRLSDGESLLKITTDLGIPYSNAYRWEREIPGHIEDSLRAREIGCHALAEQCLRIADSPLIGQETTTKADGGVEVREADMIQHRRMQIDTRMRLIGKWLPKVYGEKQAIEHSGSVGLEALIAGE
jgi:hypothetical protein